MLRFARGLDKTFRFLVEKVGNTIFFIRRENSPREIIPDVRGYGHTFPERYTTWEEDAKGSWVNQRLITYQFGWFRFLVRFEADGYLSEDDLPKASPTPAAAAVVVEDKPTPMSVQELVALVEGIEVSDADFRKDYLLFKPVKSGYRAKKSTTTDTVTNLSDLTSSSSPSLPPTIPESSTPLPPLTIRTSGPDGPSPSPIVPQAQVFDLKTRSIKARENKNTLEEELPRLWVTQIPNFILAYHTRGKFFPNDIEIRDVRPDVQLWEKERSKDKTLAKLAAVVRKLVDIVGELDEQWNGGKVKGVEGKGVVPLDGKSEEDSSEDDGEDDENTTEKPVTKTPTPIRIEVIHRFQNLDTLETRHQGWEEYKEGDGRDGVLSYTLRKEWIAAQTDTFTKKEEPR